jgi:hypothetical protein
MSDVDGTYAKLVEIADRQPKPMRPSPVQPSPEQKPSPPAEQPHEDISTTPYMSQNYRFTQTELRWLREQAYSLTDQFGMKVPQNTVLRIALHHLIDAATKNPKHNPLLEVVGRLKK